jgi:alanine racemase
MTAEARLIVDLDALAANYRRLAVFAAGAETAPVVKADAYGLGAEAVARRLWAEGARSFFVARLGEGEALRAALGPERPATVHVLDGCPDGAGARLRAADLTPVLNTLAQAQAWTGSGGGPAALHIDTGMNRLGVAPHEIADLPPGLELSLVMSHLACAEDADHPLNASQRERFVAAAEAFPGVPRSLANSAGVFLGPAFHFDMVRPGIRLYGGGPQGRLDPEVRTVATLEAPVLQVRTVGAGETVGYGAAYTAPQAKQVAIVAAGYADGVLRAGAHGGYGWANGAPCPLLGRISMDLIALDIGLAPGVGPGTMVELVGPNVAVDAAAARAGTIAYELLVRIGGGRVQRVYQGAAA